MQVPLKLTFRDVRKTPDIVEMVEKHVEKLHKFCPYLTSCRIAIERPHKYPEDGNAYRVRLEIKVPPGKDIVIKRDPQDSGMHDDLRTVLNNAFKTARRQLDAIVDVQHGIMKTHAEPVALVTKLFPHDDYGFLKTPEGRDIYFHRHSVLDGDFDRLSIGTQVRFAEEEGVKGPQASSVQIIDKLGPRMLEFPHDMPKVTPRGWEPAGRRRAIVRKRAGKAR
jgi:cold shock CspA family protein